MSGFPTFEDVEFPTPLDLFSTQIEKAFLDWGLIGNNISAIKQNNLISITSTKHHIQGWDAPFAFEEVSLSDRRFSLQVHVTSSFSNALDASPITRLFGTNAALVLLSTSADSPVAWDVSDATILLMAISLAASSASVTLPIFVPVGKASEFRLIGKRVGSVPVRFYTHICSNVKCTTVNLSSVLQFFKTQFGHAAPSARVSVKYEYKLKQAVKHANHVKGCYQSIDEFFKRVVEFDDPIVFFKATAFWDEFYAAESDRKNLAIQESDRFRLRIGFRSLNLSLVAPTQCLLQLSMHDLDNIPLVGFSAAPIPIVNSAKRKETAKNLKKDEFQAEWETFLAEALYVVAFANNNEQNIDASYIVAALDAMFYPSSEDTQILDALGPNGNSHSLFEKLARLSEKLPNVKALHYIWMLFVDAIELHWNARVPVNLNDRNTSNSPDLYESLIVQKLQMINCCIKRESSGLVCEDELGRKKKYGSKVLLNRRGELWEPHVQENALFTRDTLEEQEMLLFSGVGGNDENSKSLQSDMSAFKAANPGAQMADFIRWFSPSDWIEDEAQEENQRHVVDESNETFPEDEAPFTSELVEYEASHVARDLLEEIIEESMMTDLKAVKEKGSLSPRMRKSGNDWEKLWLSAVPCPAHLQEPLFDTYSNGLAALSDLRRIPLGTVILNLCCSTGCSTSRILSETVQTANLSEIVNGASNSLRRTKSVLPLIHRNKVELKRDFDQLTEALFELQVAENRVLVSKSLESKLSDIKPEFERVIDHLASGQEYVLESEEKKMFLQRILPTIARSVMAEEREFIVSNGTERIYTGLSSEGCRICLRSSIELN